MVPDACIPDSFYLPSEGQLLALTPLEQDLYSLCGSSVWDSWSGGMGKQGCRQMPHVAIT